MYHRMDYIPPAPVPFPWDTVFTFALLIAVMLWMKFRPNATPQQCTPDGQPSTGVYGSDCCSTNGTDANGKCLSRSPMGVPAYGMQNSNTPKEYALQAPRPAAIPTPPVPYVTQ